MLPRCSASLFAVLFIAASLAGCQQQEEAAQGVQNPQSASQAWQAVRQQYSAQTVETTLHRHGSGSQLEVVLVNPGGQEATDQQSARAIGAVAQKAYNGALDTVRVSFEYSSQAGPAEVGFHRRYAFAPGELDTTAAEPDTASTGTDTTATPAQQP